MADEADVMDDSALFSSTVSGTQDTAEATTGTTEQSVQEQGQQRDERGRSAQKTEDQAQPDPGTQQLTTEQQATQERPEQVPYWRLNEVSEARRAAEARAEAAERRAQEVERRAQQLDGQLRQYTEKPREAPDIFADPSAAIRHTVEPEFAEMRNVMTYNSRLIAQSVHGVDKVQAADEAFSRAYQSGQIDPADYQRVLRSPNIYDAAVQWHTRQQVLTRVGNDPERFFDSELAERAKDPAKRDAILAALNGSTRQAAQQSGNIVNRPVSTTSLSRVGAAALPDGQAEVSDAELFANTTSRRKRA